MTGDPATPVAINPAASERELLVQLLLLLDAGITTILERLTNMSDTVQSEVAGEAVLSAKVDLLLAAFAAGKSQLTDLQAQIAALQAQIAQGVLTPADSDALAAALADMQAKATAIDTALTPPPVTGAAK